MEAILERKMWKERLIIINYNNKFSGAIKTRTYIHSLWYTWGILGAPVSLVL